MNQNWQGKEVSKWKQEFTVCSKSGDEELITSLRIWQMVLYYLEYYSGILANVSEFRDKLRMSSRVTLTHVVMFPPGPASSTWDPGAR